MSRISWSTQLESLKSIDIKKLKEWKIFKSHSHYGTLRWHSNDVSTGSMNYSFTQEEKQGTIEFDYKIRKSDSEEWQKLKYWVQIEKQRCYFGGNRAWFRCPVAQCGRRCRKLYLWNGYFVCRKCTRCWYESQQWFNQQYRIVVNSWKADRYYEEHVKRASYAGKMTKKYKRYLSLYGDEQRVAELARMMKRL